MNNNMECKNITLSMACFGLDKNAKTLKQGYSGQEIKRILYPWMEEKQ